MSVGLQRIREDTAAIRTGAKDKGDDPELVDEVLAQDANRRRLQSEIDALRHQHRQHSEKVAAALKAGMARDGQEMAELRFEGTRLAKETQVREEAVAVIEERVADYLLRIPNPADPDVPVGPPEATMTLREWGEPLAHDADGWARRPHWEVAESLGMIDLAAGAKVTGSGFPLYRGAGSRLQRTLINWFLDIHTDEHGMTEIWPPALINADSARGTGQIPDKEDQMYVVTRDDLYLNPTAEVAVTNIHRDEIIEADRLPIHYVAYSPSFRREAGAAGRQTRGILRVHQFDKVEMVAFERPADSADVLEWMTQRAEVLLQRLGLAYRVRLLSSGDMGFTQAKTHDIEVWAPGIQEWLEVSSVSNFRDFQARRMNIRWRPEPGAKPEILHTLNGSGLALPRTVAALLEVYQQQDGSVALPEPLASKVGTLS